MKSDVTKLTEFLSEAVGNNVGKVENAGSQHFSFFPNLFHFWHFSNGSKSRDFFPKSYISVELQKKEREYHFCLFLLILTGESCYLLVTGR